MRPAHGNLKLERLAKADSLVSPKTPNLFDPPFSDHPHSAHEALLIASDLWIVLSGVRIQLGLRALPWLQSLRMKKFNGT